MFYLLFIFLFTIIKMESYPKCFRQYLNIQKTKQLFLFKNIYIYMFWMSKNIINIIIIGVF